jgi:hypothetical protein
MKESSLSNTIKQGLARTGIVHRYRRIEDACNPGTPDTYIRAHRLGSAWVELKYLKAWPVRPATVVKIDHYTAQQKLWLRDEGRMGGNAWLFIQVDNIYLLFWWEEAQRVGEMTKAQMLEAARMVWKRPCDWGEWLRIVVGGDFRER